MDAFEERGKSAANNIEKTNNKLDEKKAERLTESSMDSVKKVATADGHLIPIVRTRLDANMTAFQNQIIETPKQLVEMLARYMADLSKEVSVLACFDVGMMPICISLIDDGGLESAEIPVRDIVQIALLANARYTAILHNHPSSAYHKSLTPSTLDLRQTDAIIKACKVFQIDLFDSIIVGMSREDGKVAPAYYSMREKMFRRLYPKTPEKYTDALKWLGLKEEYLEWEGYKDANAYWGFDVTKLKLHPSVTAYCPAELEEAVKRINKVQEDLVNSACNQMDKVKALEEKKRELVSNAAIKTTTPLPEHMHQPADESRTLKIPDFLKQKTEVVPPQSKEDTEQER